MVLQCDVPLSRCAERRAGAMDAVPSSRRQQRLPERLRQPRSLPPAARLLLLHDNAVRRAVHVRGSRRRHHDLVRLELSRERRRQRHL